MNQNINQDMDIIEEEIEEKVSVEMNTEEAVVTEDAEITEEAAFTEDVEIIEDIVTAEDAGITEETGPEEEIVPPADTKIVGVRFRAAGKIYYFSPGGLNVHRGTRVIVETARGIECGTVVSEPMNAGTKRIKAPLREILRIASKEDLEKAVQNRQKEKEAIRICRRKAHEHNLNMKLIDAEYTFDGSRILFYFTAEGRIDFRDLVKDLAGIFRTRIELRQIGVRDETKILGGYGTCGRPLCCQTYLSDFVPVSIKMAKEQNLSLNPAKISGLCGRLMCCLKNEEDTYEELNRQLPKVGDEVEGNDGLQGEVESVNVLRQRVRILVEVDDEKELHEYPAEDITILRRRKRGQARPKISRRETPDGQRVRPAAVKQHDASAKPSETQDNENERPAARSSRPKNDRVQTERAHNARTGSASGQETEPQAEEKTSARGSRDRRGQDRRRQDHDNRQQPSRRAQDSTGMRHEKAPQESAGKNTGKDSEAGKNAHRSGSGAEKEHNEKSPASGKNRRDRRRTRRNKEAADAHET